MILGTGIDIVEIQRIRESIGRYGERFTRRVFTPTEIAYCEGKAAWAVHFAGRYAAKEAVMKALQTGWAGGVRWKDVAVTRNERGLPGVELSGGAQARAQQMGISRWHLSISHSDIHAVAHAIAEG